jgi:uncharacterized protein
MTDTQSLQPTTTTDNKRLVQTVFTELAAGNRLPFRDHMADDISWTVIGTTRWSRTYSGKQTVIDEMVRPFVALLEAPPIITVQRIIADDNYFAVQFRGQATTKVGKAYNNTYCMILRLAGGKICEVTEYLDTALLAAAL